MKNKGFTLVELIIVIAILAIIMLIGVPAFAKIQERMAVRADKASAAQIGKALTVRETDIGARSPIPYYSTTDGTGIVRYDEIENVENYVSKELKPKSMKDGYYFATAIQTDHGKRILVGIGRNDLPVSGAYNSPKASGWAWSEGEEITKFLAANESELGGMFTMPSNYEGVGETPGPKGNGISLASAVNGGTVKVGNYVAYNPPKKTFTINGTNSGMTEWMNEEEYLPDGCSNENQQFNTESYTGGWKVFRVKDGKVQLISAESVGRLFLAGGTGYSKSIATLNNFCSNYATGKNSARSLGCTESGAIGELPESCPLNNKATNAPPYTDSNYTNDNIISGNENLWHKATENTSTSGHVWLASRIFNGASFCVLFMDASGIMYSYGYRLYNTGDDVYCFGLGVRPVVILDSGIELTGTGDGTKGSPYGITN